MNRAARRAAGKMAMPNGRSVPPRFSHPGVDATPDDKRQLAEAHEAFMANNHERAASICRRVLAAYPDNIVARHMLSSSLIRLQRYQEAREVAEELCERDRSVDALALWIHALCFCGHIDVALELADHGVAMHPNNPAARKCRSDILRTLGRYDAAHADDLEVYRRLIPMPASFHRLDKQMWRGEPIPGKRLLVFYGDPSGFGDSISHMRFLTLAKQRSGASILFEVQPQLARLAKTVSGVDVVHPAQPRGSVLIEAEYAMHLAVLPAAMGLTLEEYKGHAYLDADKDAVRSVRETLPAGVLNVGVCWHGGQTNRGDVARSTALPLWEGLRSIPGVRFYSLQHGEPLPAAWNPTAGIGGSMDYADTAAVMKALDLVISVETSVAHLSGALGVETWVLTPDVTDGRWEWSGTRTRWYDSVTVYRQPRPRDWGSVFEQVKADLTQKAAEFTH